MRDQWNCAAGSDAVGKSIVYQRREEPFQMQLLVTPFDTPIPLLAESEIHSDRFGDMCMPYLEVGKW